MNSEPDPMGDRLDLIEAIHRTATKLVVVVTGGGATAISDLLSVPGASKTIIEAVIPYETTARASWLIDAAGGSDRETAADMAKVAAGRAARFVPDGPVAGVACTAALATIRDRRGSDRAYLAVADSTGVTHERLVELRRVDGRAEQERLVADALLEMCAVACGLGPAGES